MNAVWTPEVVGTRTASSAGAFFVIGGRVVGAVAGPTVVQGDTGGDPQVQEMKHVTILNWNTLQFRPRSGMRHAVPARVEVRG
ncbi:hypothetical protein EF294_08940 [Gordonia oryzae]|uniref:Uncharacterized protein n=1 Tax=Gordonia oryzae TaxID=2487349 RepID=A0A3N4GH37_9ACTN|nr:hypothetical protein EF294_08940 [Gordonia oryzae]